MADNKKNLYNVCSKCGERAQGTWVTDRSGFENLISECCKGRLIDPKKFGQ